MNASYNMQSPLWKYPGMDAWHFLRIDPATSQEIKEIQRKPKRGFGSIRVEVTIGKTKWRTSIFPDNKTKTYLLPVKAEVRRKENIKEGDVINFKIEVNFDFWV